MATAQEEFNVSMSLTKKELIQKYEELLKAYQKKVDKVEQTREQLTEAQKMYDDDAIVIASEVSVPGAIDAIASLRQAITSSFADLTERLTDQTQRLEALDRAIALKEARLAELHDIDLAADGLSKLTRLYQERRDQAEAQLAGRLEHMRADLQEERASLQAQIDQTRAAWEAERAQVQADRQLATQRQKLEREREQADYIYERDLERKREEDAYHQRRDAQTHQLDAERQRVEHDLAQRQAAMAQREDELANFRQLADTFPSKLDAAIAHARQETLDRLAQDHDVALAMEKKEREWETRMLHQQITHLQQSLTDLQAKIAEQKAELHASTSRVQHIAEKAVEGASMARAYQGVSDLAMEQARRPERSKPTE